MALRLVESARNHGLSIISATARPTELAAILRNPRFADIEAYPHTGAFGRSYHRAIHGDHDQSFAVCLGGVPVLFCLCAPLGTTLSFYGLPLRLFASQDLPEEACVAAVGAAFSHLEGLARQQGAHDVVMLQPANTLGAALADACMARSGECKRSPVAFVDLGAGPAAWRAALRKSSRSLINWGRRNLTIGYVNGETGDRGLFERYREFHAAIAGRITRPKASWDVMFDWIAAGHGELIAASLDGQLVAGSLFIDGTRTSIYASGVYDRSKFNKPLAHYPVWLGIERTQARGVATLELGEVPPRDAVSEKEYQIGYFKRGFATHIDTSNVWRWSAPMVAT